jgi:ATP-dependent DNA ligase
MRIIRSRESVIGGYTKAARTFDAVVFGYFDGERLIYVAKTRSGFTPASRERLMEKLQPIEVPECPFANLPEVRPGRCGEGLMAEKMKECVWVRPELVAEVEFVEWTPEGKLRHARFVGLKGS